VTDRVERHVEVDAVSAVERQEQLCRGVKKVLWRTHD